MGRSTGITAHASVYHNTLWSVRFLSQLLHLLRHSCNNSCDLQRGRKHESKTSCCNNATSKYGCLVDIYHIRALRMHMFVQMAFGRDEEAIPFSRTWSISFTVGFWTNCSNYWIRDIVRQACPFRWNQHPSLKTDDYKLFVSCRLLWQSLYHGSSSKTQSLSWTQLVAQSLS